MIDFVDRITLVVKEEFSGEAYDMTRSGIVQRSGTAEVRYRFHTRNVNVHSLLKRVSKQAPGLTFALATHRLDDNNFGAFTIHNGRLRGKWLGDDWRQAFWERAVCQNPEDERAGATLESAPAIHSVDGERERTTAVKLLDRYRGALLGLAAGDALGTTLEFSAPGTFTPIDDMVGGGPFDLKAGEWTDDTSMALCLAESLLESHGFVPEDQLARYVRWKRRGLHSSNGRCFDIGGTVMAALARFERTGEPWSGNTDPYAAGNGSIMRLAPVPLFFAADPRSAIARAADSSRTTHGAAEAVDACRYLAALILGALEGHKKEELLASLFTPVPGSWDSEPLAPKIHHVASGSFLRREPRDIRGSGYVVESLEAALWAFAKSTSFRDGALLAVNLGDDADTTGAVYGQIAGAYYGVESIPQEWREKLAHLDKLESFATRLYHAALPADW